MNIRNFFGGFVEVANGLASILSLGYFAPGRVGRDDSSLQRDYLASLQRLEARLTVAALGLARFELLACRDVDLRHLVVEGARVFRVDRHPPGPRGVARRQAGRVALGWHGVQGRALLTGGEAAREREGEDREQEPVHGALPMVSL